jgi:hypothetical protein
VTVIDATGALIFRSGAVDEFGDPLEGAVIYGTRWRDAAGQPTERLWEAVIVLRDRRIAAGAAQTEDYRIALPPGVAGPLHVRAALKYRAVSGYLGSLMSNYVQEAIPSAPEIEMAVAEKFIPVPPSSPAR